MPLANLPVLFLKGDFRVPLVLFLDVLDHPRRIGMANGKRTVTRLPGEQARPLRGILGPLRRFRFYVFY